MDVKLQLTTHAREQCAKRNLSEDGLLYVIRHGRTVRKAGTLMYYLARRDIPKADSKDQRVARLEGVAVQTKPLRDGTVLVITAYHNAETGLKDQRRKTKYDRNKMRYH